MDEDERLALMQEHVRDFIAFLELYSLDASSGLSHRPEITALEEEHPSMFRYDAYVVRIVHRFDAHNLLFVRKLHDDRREFLEGQYQLLLDLLAAILIGEEYQMMIIEMQRLREDDLSFESEMLVEVQCVLLHGKASEILQSLDD